jgi:hypothetical protein
MYTWAAPGFLRRKEVRKSVLKLKFELVNNNFTCPSGGIFDRRINFKNNDIFLKLMFCGFPFLNFDFFENSGWAWGWLDPLLPVISTNAHDTDFM